MGLGGGVRSLANLGLSTAIAYPTRKADQVETIIWGTTGKIIWPL